MRLLEQHNPGVQFDWPRLLRETAGEPPPRRERDQRERDRRDARPPRPRSDTSAAAVPPAPTMDIPREIQELAASADLRAEEHAESVAAAAGYAADDTDRTGYTDDADGTGYTDDADGTDDADNMDRADRSAGYTDDTDHTDRADRSAGYTDDTDYTDRTDRSATDAADRTDDTDHTDRTDRSATDAADRTDDGDQLLAVGGTLVGTPAEELVIEEPMGAAAERLGGEGVRRLRTRYADLIARISDMPLEEDARAQLKSTAERLNPDAWRTPDDVASALEQYESIFEGLRSVVGRHPRRRRV